MRTVKDTEKVTLKVTKSMLLQDRWISVPVVSELLKKEEEAKGLAFKYLRMKFYNSLNSNKYNTSTHIGLLFIDTENPVKATASLELEFIMEG